MTKGTEQQSNGGATQRAPCWFSRRRQSRPAATSADTTCPAIHTSSNSKRKQLSQHAKGLKSREETEGATSGTVFPSPRLRTNESMICMPHCSVLSFTGERRIVPWKAPERRTVSQDHKLSDSQSIWGGFGVALRTGNDDQLATVLGAPLRAASTPHNDTARIEKPIETTSRGIKGELSCVP